MNEPTINQIPQTETVDSLKLHNTKPKKTAQDWVRDMRMSAAVNKSNTGVETDQVTPDLMLATSKKLLGISKREQEPDAKDSLAFQRFYGPEMLFSERIQRDGGKLARNILWKATNRGNLDFMPVNALDKHISSVFYDSKLAQMMDGSSPLETIDSAYKTTRLGEGGIGSMDSAPDEMRTVQPSYFGFIDPVRSPESLRVGLDVYMTKNVMKGTDGKLYQKFIDAKTGKEVLLDSETAANSVIASNEMMDAKTKSIFALGGPTGVRIVPKKDVQYYLPRADEAYSTASNLVTMLSGVKEMRLQMGCLHPDTHVLTIDKHNLISIKKAQVTKDGSIPGSTKEGASKVFPIRTTIAKFPPKRNWFYKVVLRSGRSLITSADHRWSVLRNGKYSLIQAKDLRPGDAALRTTFKDVISRRTFVNGMLVNKNLATVLGYIARTLAEPDNIKMRFSIPEDKYNFVMEQLERIGYTEGFNTYYMNQATFCIGVRDESFKQFLRDSFGALDRDRHIPDFIMSANAAIVGAFLDGYTTDPTKVGRDSADDIWVLDIPNTLMRDSLAFLFARIETDTLYRDTTVDGQMYIAMKLAPMEPAYGDMLLDEVKVVKKGISSPIMVDIDINDNLYAVANGVVTHNSKYPLQAISIQDRQAPLVRGLDEASGKDMPSLIGKYLGARFAPKGGVVTAVRKDRIDVQYDDGTKGSVGLYVNFPMNAKGYINNTPIVKAGQSFKKGDCLASSNYTDDKGVAALGTNLRSAWMSWKGGTYEDAIVISESAAKKLTSTTMYKTAVDLDKTVKLGKQNYMTWKPGEFTKEQMEALDANGIVKPGTVLHKEDPMILAVRMTEPSPGTLGKRILTDMSERWEHDHPGVVTDVVKTRNGIKVYATVTAPAEVGDKVSNGYGAKGVLSQIIPDDEMPTDSKGRPFEILFSPLSLISRCYDDKTEFLTESGWKLGSDIDSEDKLYCYDPIENTVTMGKQLEPIYSASYTGKMYGYHDDTVDFLVTPNHKIWAKLNDKFEATVVQDIYKEAVTIPVEKDGCVYYYQLSSDCWYIEDYNGKIYCPTVSTGYIVSKREGEPVCLGNTNPSQLFEAQLGKVAAKTGKPVVVPQFFKGSITDFVEDQLKQNHLKADEDLKDPMTGKVMPDVTTGMSYIYKLKHLSESKLSARGTSTYDAEEVPAGKGMDGCFPGAQMVQIKGKLKSINALAFSLNTFQVASCTDSGEVCYYPAIDSFRKLVVPADLVTITPKWSFNTRGYCLKKPISMTPTKNHAIYMYDMTQKHAGDIKVGDKLAGIGLRPSNDMMQVLANLVSSTGMVDDDKLVVEYREGHESLAAFKCHVLSAIGAKLDKKARTITIPRYEMYHAALKDSDFGDISVCLHQLDCEAGCTDEKLVELITKFIPSYTIPDSMAELKATVAKAQRKHKPVELNADVSLGLMPLVVADIGPYITDKEQLKVYDLTIDTTHRYVLHGGFLVSNSKRFGTLEQSAMAGHGAFDIIKDSKYVRGQSNSDFWRSLRTGDIPTMPGEPLVHKKFFAHLTGAGINVKKTPQGVSIFALTNKDVDALAGPREVKSRDTYEARNFRPIDGGLFGQDIFGINGDKWGYIQLDSPVPNPVMEEPLARLLNIPDKKFADVASGKEEINGIRGGEQMKAALEKIDLEAESAKALNNFKTMSPSGKDKALKRYIAIERMRRNGVKPSEYMLDRIPVIPPVYRPITSHNGLTMVADSNYLYAQLLDARDDAREAKGLPKEFQDQAIENIYTKWKELTGLYAPQDIKLQSKHVQGLLKWALGDSPKFSAVHRKLISATVDTVGRGVVIPDPRLKLNELGIPKTMAFGIFAPIVQRKLVKMGYTPIQAMEKVKKQDVQAVDALNEVMKDHPVLMNRAPTLHKLGIMAYTPKIAAGNAIRVNPSTVVPFNMDYDGDSVHSEWRVVFDLERIKENLEKLENSGKYGLTFSDCVVHYIQDVISDIENNHTIGEQDMISKEAKARYSTAICSPSELPVLDESEIKKSSTVTEWDVCPGIYVDTLGLDGKRVLAPVTKVSKHEGLKMFDIQLSVCGRNGSVITASEDHSLITLNPETLQLEKTKPEYAVDRLVPRLRRDKSVTHETCCRYIYFDKPYDANYDLGLFLGIMIGDGWVNCKNSAVVACCDESLQKVILDLTNKMTTQLPVLSETYVSTYKADPARLSQNDRQIINLHLAGDFNKALKNLIGDGAINKRIPACCLRASRAHRLGILMGLLATDGSVTYSEGTTAKKAKGKSVLYHTISPTLRDCVSELCSSLGIRTSVTVYSSRLSESTAYAVNLSVIDVAREASHNPTMFVIPCEHKQEALSKCIKDLRSSKTSAGTASDIVPFPTALGAEISWAKAANPGCVTGWRNKGYLSLAKAKEVAAVLEAADWTSFKEYGGLPSDVKRGHTPEQAAALVAAWCSIVHNAEQIAWVHVDEVTPSTCTEGWDCTVPGPYTFSLYDGTVVQDTVNIHAPVSDAARKEAYNKMMPERNLIGMRSREILYKPEKEYQQGLYIATRMKSGSDVRTRYFNTLEEAKQAYRDGLLDVDDPIEIKHK